MAQKGIIWDAICKDDYKSYDNLVTLVKDTLAGSDNEKAYKVEDAFNALFVELMEKLEKQF